MNLQRLMAFRKLARRMGAVFFILVFVSLLDACVAKLREPIHVYNTLADRKISVDGAVDPKITNVGDLVYTSLSEQISLSIHEIKAGYWLGGTMWIGEVTVGSGTAPGEYNISVFGKNETDIKKRFVFRVIVHQDAASLRKSHRSVIHRNIGLAPWWFPLFCLPLGGLTMGALFLASKKIEEMLAAEGKSEIFRIVRGTSVQEVAFGLGSRHGMQEGMRLSLMNVDGSHKGTVEVQKVFEGDSLAFASLDLQIQEGDIVSSAGVAANPVQR